MKRILASLIAAACIGGLSFYAGRATAPFGTIQLADNAVLKNVHIVGATIVADGVTSEVYIGPDVTFSER